MRILLLALLAVALAIGSTAVGQDPCNSWHAIGGYAGADADVTAAVSFDPDGPGPSTPKLIFGGNFRVIGKVRARGIAMFDPATDTWSALAAAPTGGVDGSVRAVAALPNGDIVAGGSFASADGVPASNIARWDGVAWHPLSSGVNSTVFALAVMPNGDLVAAGTFTSAGGLPVSYIARWNGTTWSPVGTGTNRNISCLAVRPNGDLVAGGYFSIAGGVVVSGVANWNGSQWSPFGSGVFGFGGLYFVNSIAQLPNGHLVVGGYFNSAGGVPANCIAEWDGSGWSPLGTGIAGSSGFAPDVRCLQVLPNGHVIAGGDFRTAGGLPAFSIAEWDGVGWSPLGSGLGGFVYAAAVASNGDLYVGGGMVNATVDAENLLKWNGSTWSQPTPAFGRRVLAFSTLPNGNLVAGGDFRVVGNTTLQRVAQWDGTAWTPLGSWPAGTVAAFTRLPNGDLIAGGYVDTQVGVVASRPARWNGTSWTPLGFGMNNDIAALATLPNGDVVAAGWFTIASNVAANRIAAWNGNTWRPLGSGMSNFNDSVRALAVMPNGDVVAGGNFSAAGGVAASNIARWDGSAWSPIGAGTNGLVSALLLLPNGDLVAAGTFSSAGGIATNNIARWDGSVWAPLGAGLVGPGSRVNCLTRLDNGDLVAGGSFSDAGGVSANGIARWNGTSWHALDTAPFDGAVALAPRAGGDLYVGGGNSVGGIGGTVSAVLSRFHTCLASHAVSGTGCLGSLGMSGNELVAPPRIGSSVSLRLTNLPRSDAFLVIGFDDTSCSAGPLPLDLSALGMLGCSLRVADDITEYIVGSGNAATWSFALPNSSSWLGERFFTQGLVLDPGANAMGLTLSTAARLEIGI